MTERIERAAAKFREAAKAYEDADREFAEALLDASRGYMTWADIARAAGLGSVGQARSRAERAMPPDELSPSRPRAAKALSARPAAVGCSVAEAARRLGVARSTVYQMIDRGELKSEEDHLGRTRVLLGD